MSEPACPSGYTFVRFEGADRSRFRARAPSGRDVTIRDANVHAATYRRQVIDRLAPLTTLRSELLIDVLDILEDDDRVFVVTEPTAGTWFDDELGREPTSHDRIYHVVHRALAALEVLHAAGIVHRKLRATAILTTARGIVIDVPDVSYLAHAEAANRPVLILPPPTTTIVLPEADRIAPSPAGDVYAIGLLLWEAFARRPMYRGGFFDILGQVMSAPAPACPDDTLADAARDLIARCLERDPAARPTIAAVRALLPPGRPPAPRPADDEPALLAALREAPGDAASRLVYADWLEERGDHDRAAFVRAVDHTLVAGDARWRAIVSCGAVERCPSRRPSCPQRWDAFAATERDGVRQCTVCHAPVFYATTLDEHVDEAVVHDPALLNVRPIQVVGNPPAPRAPERGVISRIKGWFTKE